MGLSQPHALGRNQRFYVARESTAGTFVRPSATSAIKVLRSNIDAQLERINRRDASQTGSTITRITGRKTVSWSTDMYINPSGTAGTPPDCHDLLLAWFGTYTNTPSTSDVYTIADSQTARGSVSITREYNSILMAGLALAWVEQVKVSYTGTSLPMISFEGGAADYYHTGYTTLDDTLSGGETELDVFDVNNISVGSVISVGSSNNSAGTPPGHQVTAITGSTLTVTPAISGSQASGVVVAPYVPTETTAGTPISHVLASATLTGAITGGSTTLPVVSFEIVGKNNFEVHADEAGSQIVTDLTPSWRDTTGTITVRARRDQTIRLGNWWNAPSTTLDLAVTIGTSAGNRMVIDANQIEAENVKVETPEAETCTITIPFYCRGSSGADEWSLSFT